MANKTLTTKLATKPKYAERDVPEQREMLSKNRRSQSDPLSRDAFMVDRDRILHSKAFRRMRGKTQVFISDLDDHVRTRLTHTLEVAQIARNLARALDLNQDLVEAAAYGHDLGHTPFGHEGERMLHKIMSGEYPIQVGPEGTKIRFNCGGFKHNLQTLRISRLDSHQTAWPVEERYKEPMTNLGLNLTQQTRWAMVVHTKLFWQALADTSFYNGELEKIKSGFVPEALVVAVADEIAQLHHDLVDGYMVGLIEENEAIAVLDKVVKKADEERAEEFEKQLEIAKKNYKVTLHKGRIGAVFSRFVVSSLERLAFIYLKNALEKFENSLLEAGFLEAGGEWGAYSLADESVWVNTLNSLMKNNPSLQSVPDVHKLTPLGAPYSVLVALRRIKPEVEDKIQAGVNNFDIVKPDTWSDEIKELGRLTFKKVVHSERARRMDAKGSFVIRRLFQAYIRNPKLLPAQSLIEISCGIGKKECENVNNENIGDIKIEDWIDDGLKSANRLIEKWDSQGWLYRLFYRSTLTDLCLYARVITDHIAGMTDNYAQQEHARLYEAGVPIW